MTSYIPTPASVENPSWTERNSVIARYITEGSDIIDLGCGAKDLLRYTAPNKYLGVDYIDSQYADIKMDFNTNFTLPDEKYDFAVCSGLLEYLSDIEHFFFRIKHCAKTFIFTFWNNYSSLGNPNQVGSINDLIQLLERHYIIKHTDQWSSHTIFICSVRNQDRHLDLYWWGGKKESGNCGDIVGPYLLEKYGYQVSWKNHPNANAFCVGSIAESVNDNSTVLGSGIIFSDSVLNSKAHWRWVRGPLTRKRVLECGGNCPEVYGDAALLLPRIIKNQSVKKYSTGIVAHYIDRELIESTYPDSRIIDMNTSNLEQTILDITECETILSSSLHGIIIANAYNIPAAWISFNKLCGDDVKFMDYAKSVDTSIRRSTVKKPEFINPIINTDIIHDCLSKGDF